MDKLLCEKGNTVTRSINYGDESTVLTIHETDTSISIYVGDKNLIDAQNNIVDFENYNSEIKIIESKEKMLFLNLH